MLALAKRLNRWTAGILSFFTPRVTNGIFDGIQNLIKVLKRRACGFSDFPYFTLKILDAAAALSTPEFLTHPQF